MVSIIIPTKNRITQLSRLLDSIYSSTYKDFEVIVVNDGDLLNDDLFFKFNNIKVINNDKNMGLAYSRSVGALNSKGGFVLFIDDDNVINKDMIEIMVNHINLDSNIVAIGPLTFYFCDKNKVWFLGSKINLTTSKSYFYSYEKLDNTRLVKGDLFLTENLHNCFMVRRNIGNAVNWFDKEIFMSGTEFDMFMRIKNKFCNALLVTDLCAKCYHDVPMLSGSSLRSMGFENKNRVFYFQRNRGVFTARYGSFYQKIALFFIFYPFFFLVYGLLFILNCKWDFLKTHILATLRGYRYLILKKL